jgi:hypothetical protein
MEHSHTIGIASFRTQCRSRATTHELGQARVANTRRAAAETDLRAVTNRWRDWFRRSCTFFVLGVTLPACGGENAPTAQASDAGEYSTLTNSGNGASDAAPAQLVITPSAMALAPCTGPFAPVLESLPTSAILPVFANAGDILETGTGTATDDGPSAWTSGSTIQLPPTSTNLRAFARVAATLCPSALAFDQLYPVRDKFAPAAGAPESTAIAKDDPRLLDWASRVSEYKEGTNLTPEWTDTARALGPAGNDTTAVTSLGEGGSITVGFAASVRDGEGYDFAVFENGFSDDYLELAFVEVSSDGVNFSRFDAASLTESPVGGYGTLDPTRLQGFAGKYRLGWGTPFDLGWLSSRPEVRANLVDLSHITAIRIVDVVGDGSVRDSLGHLVYDPYPTTGSAGFDLDAVGLINVTP